MNGMIRPVSILLVMISAPVAAEDADKTLKLDNNPFKNIEVFCENQDDIKPSENDFKLIDYHTMSSDRGERQVIVTIKNTSSGGRSLNSSHFVATLGNCQYIKPIKFERKFMGKEVLTLTLDFGYSQYPILQVLN